MAHLIELQTLGAIDVRRADGATLEAVVVQPKRLALLIYLAAAPGFLRRDTLMALFWPELDTERARGALRQAIYFLRGALGEGVIITRGDELAIDASRLAYDVRGFERAAADNDSARALELYGDGFLRGFHVTDVGAEFEQWVDAEGERLRVLGFRAAQDLVDRSEAMGDLAAAIAWARRSVMLQPQDEPATRRLISLLDAIGDRAGALRAYEIFAARLSSEQEVEPSIETRQLVEAVRQRDVPAPAGLAPRPSATLALHSSRPGTQPATVSAVTRDAPRRHWLALAALAVVGATGWIWDAATPARKGGLVAGARPLSASAEARDLYALGNRQWESRTDSSLRRAVDYYEQSIEKDPGFAAAHAGLAAAYAYLGTGNYADFSAREAGVRAKTAATRAVALDDSLADAHAVLGFVRMLYDYDFAGADAAFSRAAQLDPRSARTALFRSIYLDWVGRFDDAVAEGRRAVSLDPASVTISTEFARALFFARRYDAALEELERARSLDSTFARIYLTAGEIYAMKGDYPRAIALLSRDVGTPGRPPRTLSLLGLVLARSGERARALHILDDLKARARVGGVGAFDVASVYVGLGDYDQVFLWLDRAYDDRSLRPFLMDPTFEDVRRDPRMAALFSRIGLEVPR